MIQIHHGGRGKRWTFHSLYIPIYVEDFSIPGTILRRGSHFIFI
jgi:hypothetical protein